MVTKQEREILRELRREKSLQAPVRKQERLIKSKQKGLKQFISKREKKLTKSDLVRFDQGVREIEKEKRKLSRTKFGAGARKDISGFGQQIRSLGKDVPIQQPIQQAQFEQPVQRQPKRRGTGITNFFSHRSEKEVFGDEGLTFFDSQKTSRGKSSTAELFGVGG